MLSLYMLLALPLVVAVLGSAVVSLVLCFHDLFRRRQSLPSLHFRDSALNSRLLSRCGLRQRVFSPSFWLSSPHVQTVLAACWPRGGDAQEHVTFQREYLQMRDKGVVALDWVLNVQPRLKRKATVLLVLPPVTGDAHTCSALCELAIKRGFRIVVFNRRGHGGSVLTTAKLLSAADPSDLRQVIKYLRMRFPKSRLAAVAYGTGCGLLISYLGEFGSSAFLSAGACVSPCYDTVEKFSGSLRSLYDLVHLLKLKWILLQHAKALSSLVDVMKALLKAWSFRTYEEAVYCRMYNYTSRSDSTSRSGGNHSTATSATVATAAAVAVNVNGVAATASSAGAVNASSSPVAGGFSSSSNGGLVCGSVPASGGLSRTAGAPNGDVLTREVCETDTKLPGSAASQPASFSTIESSQSASTSSQPSSLSGSSSASGGPLASHSSLPLSTSSSSALSQQQLVSQSVTDVSSQPSSSASDTGSDVHETTSSLDSTATPESTSTSGCSSKCAATSKLPPGWASRATFSSPSSSRKGSAASQPKLTAATRSSILASSSASQLTASVPVTRSKSTSLASPPPSLAGSRAASSSVSSSSSPYQLPPSQPTSSSSFHSSPSPPQPSPSPSSATNVSSNNGNSPGSLEEYWERNNPIRDVDDIAVPVLCINSLDDPFFVSNSTSAGGSFSSSSSTIPYDLFRCYPNFLLVVTEKGGHCGFLERYPFKSWADSLCLDYLEAVFELTTRGYVSATAATMSGSTSSASSSNSRRNTRSTI